MNGGVDVHSIAIKLSPLKFALDLFFSEWMRHGCVGHKQIDAAHLCSVRIWCNCAKCDYSQSKSISLHSSMLFLASFSQRSQDTIQPSNWHRSKVLQFHNSIPTKSESDQNMGIKMCQYYCPYYTRTCAVDMCCVCRLKLQNSKSMIASCFNGISIRLAFEWWQQKQIKK